MDELIAELEGANEGSQEFDWAIAKKAGWKWKSTGYGMGDGYWDDPNGKLLDLNNPTEPPLAFTTSLDATLTLVSKGMTWSIGSSGVCHVGTEHGKGKTPELGFVIAALKARRATLSPARKGGTRR